MAQILNANNLAVYITDTDIVDKPPVFDSSTNQADAATLQTQMSGVANGTYIVINANGTYRGLVVKTGAGVSFVASEILGAATSSTLDVSNSIADVARDGVGGLIQEKDTSFTISAEGLVEAIADESARNLVEIARLGEYVIVEFTLDANTTYTCLALVDNVSVTGAVDETATYSVSFAGIDDLYIN